MISKHDIICLSETKVGPDERPTIDNYSVQLTCRKKNKKALTHSGGLAIYIKDSIRNGVTVIPNNNSEYAWLKLDRDFFNLRENIFICFTYISPEGSHFTTEADILDMIKRDLTRHKNSGQCLVMGDMNGYTNTLPDFNNFDDNTKVLPLPENYICDKPTNRRNSDPRPPNNRGKDILDFCKSTGLRIINGRKLGDLNGKFTCFDARAETPSVIDYAIAEHELHNEISFFRVLPFTPFSDHCPLEIKINANFTIKMAERAKLKLKPPPVRYKWDSDISDTRYRLTLNNPWSVKKLDSIRQANYSQDSLGINNMTSELTEFMKAAAKCAMIPRSRPVSRSNKRNSKVRQNQQCFQLDKEIRSTCKLINKDPYDKALRQKFYSLKRKRRKILKAIAKESRAKLLVKLNDMYDSDPREYWNIVSQLEELHTEKSQPNENIAPSKWLEHFKALMQKD